MIKMKSIKDRVVPLPESPSTKFFTEGLGTPFSKESGSQTAPGREWGHRAGPPKADRPGGPIRWRCSTSLLGTLRK